MEQLDKVVVQGQSVADPLEPIFGTVYAVLGQEPNAERIKAQVAQFRAANKGSTNQELIDLAKSEVPKMVGSILSQPKGAGLSGMENREDVRELNEMRSATARDRQGRQFLSYGASALDRNPTEAGKAFVDVADEPYKASLENFTNRQLARQKDLENIKGDIANQTDAVKLQGERMGLAQKGQSAVLAANQNDPESMESRAAQAAAVGALKAAGRPDLVAQIVGMNKSQVDNFMASGLSQYMKTAKEAADIKNVYAQASAHYAGAAQAKAGARKTNAEAGLAELTTTAATKGYEETGQVPAAVQEQVYDEPTLARVKAAQSQLNKLSEQSKQREHTKALLNSIDGQIKTLTTGPMVRAGAAQLVPQYQKLMKDLADLEIQTGKDVGATDAARALASQANPDVTKYNSTIRSITAKLRSEAQKDDIINQKLMQASRSGNLKTFNEPLERTKLITLVATRGGEQIIETFNVDDDKEAIKQFKERATKAKATISTLRTQ
jgi:hypothetical protein